MVRAFVALLLLASCGDDGRSYTGRHGQRVIVEHDGPHDHRGEQLIADLVAYHCRGSKALRGVRVIFTREPLVAIHRGMKVRASGTYEPSIGYIRIDVTVHECIARTAYAVELGKRIAHARTGAVNYDGERVTNECEARAQRDAERIICH